MTGFCGSIWAALMMGVAVAAAMTVALDNAGVGIAIGAGVFAAVYGANRRRRGE